MEEYEETACPGCGESPCVAGLGKGSCVDDPTTYTLVTDNGRATEWYRQS